MNYDDIIDLPHRGPRLHRPMPIENRAAQFAPFAALSGHNEAIAEASRFTINRPDLSDEERQIIATRLAAIIVRMNEGEEASLTVTYFCPDPLKDGGKLATTAGCLKKFDNYDGTLTLDNGRKIRLFDIVALSTNNPSSTF